MSSKKHLAICLLRKINSALALRRQALVCSFRLPALLILLIGGMSWSLNSLAQGDVSDSLYSSLSGQEKLWLKMHPRVEIGFNPDMEPLLIVDNEGNRSGFLIDLLDRLQDETGLGFDLKVDPWPQIISAIEKGRLDGLGIRLTNRQEKASC